MGFGAARVRAIARWGGALAASLFATGCLSGTPEPDRGDTPVLAYRLDGARGAAGRVTVRIESWPAGKPKLFQAPVYYPDNPVSPVPGLRAADLEVTDARGRRLEARDSATGDPADGNLIRLPEAARAFAYAIDLSPSDSTRFGLPVPGIGPGVDALDGAYLFALPVLEADVAGRWRAPTRLAVDIVAPGRALVGVDAHLDLSTPYELMFVRAALDPLRSLSLRARSRTLTVYATTDSALDLAAFGDRLSRSLGLVEDSLLPLPADRFWAGENPAFWGVEGVQGYWFNKGAAPDPMVQVHEVLHTYIGIHEGDREDPWWKEGTTQYLGWLLSLQAGWVTDSAFAAEVLASHDTVPAVARVPLSAPAVRTRLFLPLDTAWRAPDDPEGYIQLVYGKGGQAMMILDRWLLEGSGGRVSAFDLARALIRNHAPAFSRADLVAETARLSGRPSAAFLSALLDGTGAFPADSLRSTYRALRSLGRFAPGGGKLPVAGADPPAAKRTGTGVTRKIPHGGKL